MLTDIGTTIGCLLPTIVADLFGRKLVYLFCTWTTIILSAIQALSPSLEFYALIGLVSGITQQVLDHLE